MTRSLGGAGGGFGGGRGDRTPTSPRQNQVQPARIDFGKRAVALILDFAAAYTISAGITMLPFVGQLVPMQLMVVLLFLIRDFFFDGRGIGKNLMGLRVVDVSSGNSVGLLQSFLRNVILLAPFLALYIIGLFLRFLPIPWFNQMVSNLAYIVGTVYCVIVIPLEGYRAYSRDDSLRLGDEFAGTAVVESSMDFSSFLPR